MIVGLDMTKLTDTERRIVNFLGDGGIYSADQIIQACFCDDLASKENVQMHISNLRKKVAGSGLLISCVVNGRKSGYLMSRRLHKDR